MQQRRDETSCQGRRRTSRELTEKVEQRRCERRSGCSNLTGRDKRNFLRFPVRFRENLKVFRNPAMNSNGWVFLCENGDYDITTTPPTVPYMVPDQQFRLSSSKLMDSTKTNLIINVLMSLALCLH